MKNNRSHFKLIIILFVVCTHFISACNKLDEEPIGLVSPETYFNSASQAESVLVSATGELWQIWNDYSYGWQYFNHDDQLDGGNLNISYTHAEELWSAHWSSLLNINTLLKAVNAGRIKNATQAEIDLIVGQAKFLRGYNYFMLVRMYGGVPLYTDKIDDPALNPLPRASVAEVYNLIVSDFQEAAAKLPNQWSADKKGRPSSGAAKGLLAKTYLTMATAPLNDASNYAKAATVAKEIIDAGIHSLTPNIEDVFLLQNKYSSEMMWSFNSNYEDLSTDAQIWAPSEWSGWGDYPVDPLWESVWPDQPRKKAYLVTEIDGVNYKNWENKKPAVRKFLIPNISEDDLLNSAATYNCPIIRFADVLLIYAEAANMANNGPTQAACDAINKVIDRANGHVINPLHPRFTTAMTQKAFDDGVIEERSWELCFEFDRWFDLVRKRILKDKSPRYVANFSDADYLFPIPEKDLRLNKLLIQNPGYATP